MPKNCLPLEAEKTLHMHCMWHLNGPRQVTGVSTRISDITDTERSTISAGISHQSHLRSLLDRPNYLILSSKTI